MFQQQQRQQDVDFFTSLNSNRVRGGFLETELTNAARTQNSTAFSQQMKQECRRLAGFIDSQQTSLEVAAKQIFHRAHSLSQSKIRNASEASANVQDLKQSTQRMVDDCVALQEFYSQNRNLLMQLAVKADTELPAGQYVASLQGGSYHPFLTKAYLNSSLVCVISDTFEALRQTKHKLLHGDGENALWQAPSSFERNTTKYWVPHESMTKLMMICAAEAPLLVYGKQGPLTATNVLTLKSSEGDKLWESLATKITSIYFDSNSMDLYRERLKRTEGAQLLRARWYGSTMPQGDKPIFVELKTHHERWVNRKSVKERATIQERDMPKFLEPVRWTRQHAKEMILRAVKKGKELKPDQLAKQTDLLLRMHNLVVNHKLTACVRSVYDRAAFQSAKSNDLRLTLDRNVTLVNERIPRTDNSSWCLSDAQAQIAPATVVPFNVFEIKLAGNDPMPMGLANAMNDNTIQVATKFSKFLTGAAAFNVVPVLPYWAAHPAFHSFFGIEDRIKNANTLPPKSSSGGEEASNDYKPMTDTELMHQDAAVNSMAGTITIGGLTIAPANPAKIEPKTYFANERTYVQWINSAVLLLSISGFLLNAGIGTYNSTAAIVSLTALGIVIYSSVLYAKRLMLLKVREPYGYFNKANPIFLASVVGLTVFLIWADSIKGEDLLALSNEESLEDGRRMLIQTSATNSMLRGTDLERYLKNPCRAVAAPLSLQGHPSAVALDAGRGSILVAAGNAIYLQPAKGDGFQASSKAKKVLTIPHSHLQGLTYIGDRLFAVSDGPQQMEMMELTWWKPAGDYSHEQLRMIESWPFDEQARPIRGFTFVPTTNTPAEGAFYVHAGSSMNVYSIPNISVQDQDSLQAGPKRLKSLNMKAFGHGHEEDLSSMTTFEGITYMLKPKENALEAWNMTDGTHLSNIELPEAPQEWKGFVLERSGTGMTDSVYLHLLMTSAEQQGSQIWRFPVHENMQASTNMGRFFFDANCAIEMN